MSIYMNVRFFLQSLFLNMRLFTIGLFIKLSNLYIIIYMTCVYDVKDCSNNRKKRMHSSFFRIESRRRQVEHLFCTIAHIVNTFHDQLPILTEPSRCNLQIEIYMPYHDRAKGVNFYGLLAEIIHQQKSTNTLPDEKRTQNFRFRYFGLFRNKHFMKGFLLAIDRRSNG